jgi:SAM-dependent methyltransferase
VGGDARQLPLRDAAADVVLCSDLLEHLTPSDVSLALAEMARITKPGGIALVHTSVYGFYFRRWLRRAPGREPLDADDLKDGHRSRLKPKDLDAAVTGAGFVIRKKRYYKHVFQPLVALATRAAAGDAVSPAGREAKTARLRGRGRRFANALRIALAQLDVYLFGWWLAGGAVVYKLER